MKLSEISRKIQVRVTLEKGKVLMPTETVILIPVYQPTEKLRQLLQDLRGQTMRPIVLVDDGNLEPNQQRFLLSLTNLGFVHLVHHAFHKGRGASLKTGFAYIQQHFPTATGVATAYADSRYHATDVIKIAERLEGSSGEFIHGAGHQGQSGLESALFELVTGQPCVDIQTGLRGIPATELSSLLEVSGQNVDFELNALVDVARRQVPIVTESVTDSSKTRLSGKSIGLLLKHLFFSSSGVLLDLALFTIFVSLFAPSIGGLILAGVLARLLSTVAYHILNARWLLAGHPSGHSVKHYIYLAVALMVISALSVAFLSQVMGHPILLKVAIDGLLFLVTYRLQRNLLSGRHKADTTGESDELAVHHA